MTSFSAGCLDKMIFPQWMSWLASVSWNYDPASEILGHFPLTCTNTQTYSPHILVTTSNRGNSHLDLCFVWSQIAVILYPNHQMPSFENQKQIMHSLNFTWARAPDIEGLTTILSHIICNWLRIQILFNFKKAFVHWYDLKRGKIELFCIFFGARLILHKELSFNSWKVSSLLGLYDGNADDDNDGQPSIWSDCTRMMVEIIMTMTMTMMMKTKGFQFLAIGHWPAFWLDCMPFPREHLIQHAIILSFHFLSDYYDGHTQEISAPESYTFEDFGWISCPMFIQAGWQPTNATEGNYCQE